MTRFRVFPAEVSLAAHKRMLRQHAAAKAADTRRRRYRETSTWDGADKADVVDRARAEKAGTRLI